MNQVQVQPQKSPRRPAVDIDKRSPSGKELKN
jgi:hypothetical protein